MPRRVCKVVCKSSRSPRLKPTEIGAVGARVDLKREAYPFLFASPPRNLRSYRIRSACNCKFARVRWGITSTATPSTSTATPSTSTATPSKDLQPARFPESAQQDLCAKSALRLWRVHHSCALSPFGGVVGIVATRKPPVFCRAAIWHNVCLYQSARSNDGSTHSARQSEVDPLRRSFRPSV
jgi:hypothetical protein